tara:strand:- start:124 stop:555 length:432 start_codon:yes stop_codon:yes gene_type:complete
LPNALPLLICWSIPSLFGNGGVDGYVKKISKNRYLYVWRVSFACSYRNRPAKTENDRDALLQPFQNSLVCTDYFFTQSTRTRFSEKRSQIPILGLDSLLLQAYNPAPLPQMRNYNWLKGLAQTLRRCLKKLEAFWKKFAGSGA